MGMCKYCGEPAGFLRWSHRACKKAFNQGKSKVADLVGAVTESSDVDSVVTTIGQIGEAHRLDMRTLTDMVATGWGRAVEAAFEDGILSEDEEKVLTEIVSRFDLKQSMLDRRGAYSRMIKGAILRDIINGKIPERISVSGDVPFNLQKNEKLIYLFTGVEYYEQKTRTQYVGGSQGASIRIAKGVYYRVGAFKGERVQTQETVHADTGMLGITNKHLYFSGGQKGFRIAHNKIVTLKPYADGVGVMKDGARAKPQSFVTGDGWFTYNLMANVSQL